jgi:hypothetical protein
VLGASRTPSLLCFIPLWGRHGGISSTKKKNWSSERLSNLFEITQLSQNLIQFLYLYFASWSVWLQSSSQWFKPNELIFPCLIKAEKGGTKEKSSCPLPYLRGVSPRTLSSEFSYDILDTNLGEAPTWACFFGRLFPNSQTWPLSCSILLELVSICVCVYTHSSLHSEIPPVLDFLSSVAWLRCLKSMTYWGCLHLPIDRTSENTTFSTQPVFAQLQGHRSCYHFAVPLEFCDRVTLSPL